jgi:ABC-type branched-subunit amino acid transport system permease subunit
MYQLTTRTRAGSATAVAVLVAIVAGLALPAVASRGVIQNLFFILTMLTLAQIWNLLAGYGGLVSVGQQAFVGIGAYAMFAGVIRFSRSRWAASPRFCWLFQPPSSLSDCRAPISPSAPGSWPR